MTNPLWDGLFARHEGSAAPFLHLEDGRTVTYGEVLGLAARYAHLLTEHGPKPRDRVAVQVAKSPEALPFYAACVQTGIVFLPLNTAYTPAETEFFVSDSGPAARRRPRLRDAAEHRQLLRLAGFKRPGLIEVIDELPRNTMGKVQKAALRKRYAETVTGAGDGPGA